MSKNTGKRVLAALLCVTISAGAIGTIAYAAGRDADGKADASENASEAVHLDYTYSDTTAKEETVYVLADASGQAEKVIVSDWLRNGEKADEMKDQSSLRDIENVKGDEKASADGENLTWPTAGHDIFYQGTTDKESPIRVSVRYRLDGKDISPQDLSGKDGRVTIRFDYENKLWETRLINGKNERLAVPFAAVTGLILDVDHFQNVQVTNGKYENMGEQIVAFGLAFPGLSESLNMEELDIPDYVEISADVTDFSLAGSVTMISADLLKHVDTSTLDISSLKDGLQKLREGSSSLLDGSGQLYDGLAELQKQSAALVEGVALLSSGTQQLQSGLDTADGGAATIHAGAAQISEGLGELTGNSAALNAGAQQIFQSVVVSASQELQAQLAASGLPVTAPALTTENYAAVLGGLITKVQSLPIPGADVIVGKLSGVKASLDNCQKFCTSLQTYTDGVDAAALGAAGILGGSDTLIDGLSQMREGCTAISGGVQSMSEKMPELTGGVAKLTDGSKALNDGITTLVEEGIRKFADSAEADLTGLKDRVTALVDMAQAYNNFSGKCSQMDGSVKFIYKTDEISAAAK